jgi:hypothetical protein
VKAAIWFHDPRRLRGPVEGFRKASVQAVFRQLGQGHN